MVLGESLLLAGRCSCYNKSVCVLRHERMRIVLKEEDDRTLKLLTFSLSSSKTSSKALMRPGSGILMKEKEARWD